MSKKNTLHLSTPGEILLSQFIKPSNITQKTVAEGSGIPASRLNEIIKGRQRITAEYAYRLGKYWGMSAQFWLNLQNDYELRSLIQEKGKHLDAEVKPLLVA